MPILDIACTNCGRSYPIEGFPYKCPKCGGVFDTPAPFIYKPQRTIHPAPGIWRYRETFGLPGGAQAVSLGEGDTPLLWAEFAHRQVVFKCEYLNPTGSFKDRGSAVLAAVIQSRGISETVEDSSGNAGASFAAYAARAGLRARIFVPATTSGPKRSQIETFGAELVPVNGVRSDVANAVSKEADTGAAYASHAYLPFNLPGYATTAFEIFEQLGGMPSAVISPVGQGGLLLGLYRGFEAIRLSGAAHSMPRMIGVQARRCAPLWAMLSAGPSGLGFVSEGETVAEGVRVRFPVRGDQVIRAVKTTGGSILAVDEAEILPARDELARLGFYVEPTSAIACVALKKVLNDLPDPVVVILTGSGYKTRLSD